MVADEEIKYFKFKDKHQRSLPKELTCREGQLCVDHIHKYAARRLDHNVLSTRRGNDYQACLGKVKHIPNIVYLVSLKIEEGKWCVWKKDSGSIDFLIPLLFH